MKTVPEVTQLHSALSFQGIAINIVYHDGRPWIPGADVSHALGYRNSDQASKIFSRKKSRFTDDMALSSNSVHWEGLSPRIRRLFSPRGCHLLANLVKTDQSEEFSKWIVDVLEKVEAPRIIEDGDLRPQNASSKFESPPPTGCTDIVRAPKPLENAPPSGPLVKLAFSVEIPASAAAEICALVARLSSPIGTTTGEGE